MASPATSAKRAATLLFCHGAGFCKEIWTPVVALLKQSPLLQRVPSSVDMVSFDLPYHGENRDVSHPSVVDLGDPASPRVSHPAMNWGSVVVPAVQRQVQLVGEREGHDRAPLIGIGHSMGAAALWATEAANPGTFDGLVLFEPIVNIEEFPKIKQLLPFLVSITLKRRASWNSLEEAAADLMKTKTFARWDPTILKNYIKGAVVKVNPENNAIDPESKYALSCHPLIEASFYSNGSLRMTDEELAKPKCPITLAHGSRTQLFSVEHRRWLVEKFPELYSIAEAVPDASHSLLMEDPNTCVNRIVDALEKLPPFASAPRVSRV